MTAKDNTTKRLPCPFCGYAPKYEDCGDSFGDEPHHVCCDNKDCDVRPSTWGRSKYMATKYWNRRA